METHIKSVPKQPHAPENQVEPKQQLSQTKAAEVSYTCPCCIAREKVLASRGEH